METAYYSSKLGLIKIEAVHQTILSIQFVNSKSGHVILAKHALDPDRGAGIHNGVLKKCVNQLDEYFKGKRKRFSLPLAKQGTAFQQKVWSALQKISFGSTESYAQIAQWVRNPKAMRAVGMANKKNPWVIVVPCHRVINKDGQLGGYACGQRKKGWLLKHERSRS
ncbi:MAG: methylated-DNA--[protein]-cysteine S-methyltransferase [Deltaproteobacteria bacterium]|nr:methylated-DNA--[protein]-cysteine S-methyltransferase [Deltaproteobacteria bacterium]